MDHLYKRILRQILHKTYDVHFFMLNNKIKMNIHNHIYLYVAKRKYKIVSINKHQHIKQLIDTYTRFYSELLFKQHCCRWARFAHAFLVH